MCGPTNFPSRLQEAAKDDAEASLSSAATEDKVEVISLSANMRPINKYYNN